MKIEYFGLEEFQKVRKINVIDLVKEVSLQKSPDQQVAFVSPANSLGFMDGGVDLGYMNCFKGIQEQVKEGFKALGIKSLLKRNYLPVSYAMAFKVPGTDLFFVSAPSMFLPQDVSDTENPYDSFKSAVEICKYLKIDTMYTTTFCTGYGKFDKETSLKLMDVAESDSIVPQNVTTLESNGIVYYYWSPDPKTVLRVKDRQPGVYANTEFYVEMQ